MMEETLIICMRIADMKRPILGSMQRQCHACGEGIWVSPSSLQNMLEMPGLVRLQCGHCAIPVIIREKAEPLRITDNQLLEVAKEFLRAKE